MVNIYDVGGDSLAERAGIRAGDYLISINGNEINDVLDYSFYITERHVILKIHRGPELIDVSINKNRYEDIGLEFKTFLMDEKRSCRNKCIFCFIDQLPKGMRESLYFKDDDSRLTFLSGNYITLTNMDENEIARIIKMKMSPINISVHTTNPELRRYMLNNKNAGNAMSVMKRFAEAGILMNCQIVLCKGVNDGVHLDRTMRDLYSLTPKVASVSIVPAGLTDHRENLFPLEPYTPDECKNIIKQVETFAERCYINCLSRVFFCGDELYIKAGLPLHDEDYYEGYPQIENGVGLVTSMQTEFDAELENIQDYNFKQERWVSIATGEAAYDFICGLVEKLTKLCYDFHCKVYKIRNDYFGKNITVAGLLTGEDIAKQLWGMPLGTKLYLPAVTLRHDSDVFLDNVTVKELSDVLRVEIGFINNNGADFIKALLS